MLQYNIMPDFKTHQWHITLQFHQPNNQAQTISLPNWLPGSYLIRDFSRHITSLTATCNGQAAELTQINKNTWHTTEQAGAWQINYTVYAYDLSVRGSFLTTERAFFDGACLFLQVTSQAHTPHQITLHNLPSDWQIATTLPHISNHTFQAAHYAELIDHPIELGHIETLHFEACGIPHRIAISGHYPPFDRQRLINDIQKICQTELQLFPSPAPFTEYLFLLHLGDNLYGGLEHISSTALLADRHSLPAPNLKEANDSYTQLLGLFSHEYFHAWNVKSIKPAVFVPYKLDQESYTEQLWAFEGITSFYDDLFLARSRTISPEAYLKLLAQNLTRVQQGKGRLKQTLAQSSFTAWNKYYKQDENSPNAIVSYYQKGALAALCLDLTIRQQSQGQHSLDSVMQQHYRDWCASQQGIPEQQWQTRCQQYTQLDLQDFFQTALYSTQNLPLQPCLASIGIELQWHALERSHGGDLVTEFPKPQAVTDFGARYTQNSDGITLNQVFNGGSAENAGLCPQDKIIALNHFASSNFSQQWAALNAGDRAQVHYFRHGVLHHTELIAQAAEANTALLKIIDHEKLEQWLFGYSYQMEQDKKVR